MDGKKHEIDTRAESYLKEQALLAGAIPELLGVERALMLRPAREDPELDFCRFEEPLVTEWSRWRETLEADWAKNDPQLFPTLTGFILEHERRWKTIDHTSRIECRYLIAMAGDKGLRYFQGALLGLLPDTGEDFSISEQLIEISNLKDHVVCDFISEKAKPFAEDIIHGLSSLEVHQCPDMGVMLKSEFHKRCLARFANFCTIADPQRPHVITAGKDALDLKLHNACAEVMTGKLEASAMIAFQTYQWPLSEEEMKHVSDCHALLVRGRRSRGGAASSGSAKAPPPAPKAKIAPKPKAVANRRSKTAALYDDTVNRIVDSL